MPEMVVCVPSKKVWLSDGFTSLVGEYSAVANNHLYDLLDYNAMLIYRDIAEDDIDYKQIIVYGVIRNGEQWYKYRRGSGDGRLVDNYSIGVGGHVNFSDVRAANYDMIEAVHNAIMRELGEEIKIRDCDSIRERIEWVGIINDNSNRVGQVHLGIVFEFNASGYLLYDTEPGIMDAGFEDMEEIKRNIESYESWSQILIQELGE